MPRTYSPTPSGPIRPTLKSVKCSASLSHNKMKAREVSNEPQFEQDVSPLFRTASGSYQPNGDLLFDPLPRGRICGGHGRPHIQLQTSIRGLILDCCVSPPPIHFNDNQEHVCFRRWTPSSLSGDTEKSPTCYRS
jgi:hypothetical protein